MRKHCELAAGGRIVDRFVTNIIGRCLLQFANPPCRIRRHLATSPRIIWPMLALDVSDTLTIV